MAGPLQRLFEPVRLTPIAQQRPRNRQLPAFKFSGGLENRRDYLSELGLSPLRRDVGSSICPEGSSVFCPNGLPLPVRNIG